MKKNIVKIIVAAAVFILLAAGTILLKMPPKTDTSETAAQATAVPTYTIYKEESENVKSVLMETEGFAIEGTRLEDGSWTINNLPETEIDKTKAKTFGENSINLTTTSITEENPSDLAKYGLDVPKTTLTVNKTDGTSVKIFIGSKSPVNSEYFVKTSQGDAVYALSSYRVDTLTNPLSYYTEFTRFSIDDASSISGIAIERPDITINLVRDDESEVAAYYSSWVMTSPIETAANSDYVSSTILESLAGIKLSSPVTEGDFGFDKPSAKLRITFKPYNQEKQEYEAEYTEELVIGKKSEGNFYVGYKDKAYTVSESSLEFINTSMLNMVTKIQSLLNITGVERVDIAYRGATHSLEITHSGEDGSEMSFKLDGSDIDEDSAKKMYQALIGIQIDGLYDNQPLGETVMSVNYKGYNGADGMNVEFKSINDLDCAFVKDGKTQFTIKKSIINTLMDTVDSYVNR